MGILRPMARARRMVALTLGLVVAVSASPAWADADAVARAREEARALADKGYAELQRGRYDAAIELFSKAEAKFHAPTILLMLADAQVKAQRLIEAKATYERIASESLVNYAPQEFFDAQKKARAAATSLISRIPRLTIRVSGAPPEKANVTLDGKPVPVEFIGKAIAVDPGQHIVSHRAEGMQLASVSVLLKERADEKLTLNLVAEAREPVVTAAPAEAAPPSPPPVKPTPSEPAASWTAQLPGYAMLGLGAVGLVAGSVTGAMTLSQASSVTEDCTGNVCPSYLADEADAARSLGTISTVSFVVGAALVAGGGVWLALDPLGGDAPKSDARASRGLTQLGLGPGTFALRGTF
jgi:hypothetical protein